MKNSLKKITALIAVALITISCSKSDPAPEVPVPKTCVTTGTDFQNIFGTGGTNTYDFDVHSYEFKVNTNKTICKIGYQSTVYNTSTPYTIKILQGTTVLYNQPHTFTSAAVSYITPSSAISFVAGVTYTIERIQTNSGPNNDQNIGNVKTSTFPLSSGDMTIVGSKFYFVSANGTLTYSNTKLPFIDIVFQ